MIRASVKRFFVSDHMYQSRCSLSRDDRADAASVCLLDEECDVLHTSVIGEYRAVVGDVVAAISERALLKGQQPDAVHAEPLEILELLDQADEIADAVVVAVVERADRQLVEHGLLEPGRITHRLEASVHACGRTCRMCAGRSAGSSRT